ncbi:MAG TPA: hypothetical protein VGQ65_11520 [Thermoanaerobaculia bacterium]|jgi:hypothetical protein|nr:hypothetical protein [Thermoanaerobaculia bacterium]
MRNEETCAITDANAFYAQLNQFTGSTEFYPHWLRGFRYTEGVCFLAERTRCYWLIDLIAILQVRALKDAWLREFQLWELFVKGGSAILTCSRDSEDVAFREVIETTDFPITYVHLYVEGGVLMLPSEH